jgi:hypothetical protein
VIDRASTLPFISSTAVRERSPLGMNESATAQDAPGAIGDPQSFVAR